MPLSRLQPSWQPTPMKFLHAADIHIDSPLLGLVDRTGAAAAAIMRVPVDRERGFRWIVNTNSGRS